MHALFFNVIGSGHVNPTLPVVDALCRRGDRVTYFTSPKRRAAVESVGATYHNYGYDGFTVADYHPKSFFPLQLLPAAVGILPYLLEESRRLAPDLIVTDTMAPWGLVVAKVLGLPVVASVSTLALTHEDVHRAMGGLNVDDENRRAIDLLASRYDARFDERELGVHFAANNLVYTTAQFNPPIAPGPHHFEFVGPMVQRPTDVGDFPLDAFRAFQGTRIYVSMGTVLGEMMRLGEAFYAPFFEAWGGRDDHLVVVSTGDGVDLTTLRAPGNFIVRRSVPQLEILRHADVFVTHAGMNSMSEALYHGVPMIALPGFGDQPVNAARLTELGTGLTLDSRNLDATTLHRALDRISREPSFRQAALSVSREFRAAGGPAQAVAFLDSVQAR